MGTPVSLRKCEKSRRLFRISIRRSNGRLILGLLAVGNCWTDKRPPNGPGGGRRPKIVGEHAGRHGDEDVLTFDVPDAALDRAASAEGQAFTLAYCTHPWYNCPWPQ